MEHEIIDIKPKVVLPVKDIRKMIMGFEQVLKNTNSAFIGDNSHCPLKHSFSDGIYVREITIPKDTILTGKIHKHEHPNFLLKGKVMVITENGEEILEGPCSMISPAGTKRGLYSLTEIVWTTVHLNPTNTQDLDELEELIIAPSYDEYEKYIANKKGIGHKIKKLLIKTLSK